jgi:hypothetical protein
VRATRPILYLALTHRLGQSSATKVRASTLPSGPSSTDPRKRLLPPGVETLSASQESSSRADAFVDAEGLSTLGRAWLSEDLTKVIRLIEGLANRQTATIVEFRMLRRELQDAERERKIDTISLINAINRSTHQLSLLNVEMVGSRRDLPIGIGSLEASIDRLTSAILAAEDEALITDRAAQAERLRQDMRNNGGAAFADDLGPNH